MKPDAGQIDPKEAFWQVHEKVRTTELTPEEKNAIIMVHPAAIEKTLLYMLGHQKGWVMKLIENMRFGAINPTDPRSKEELEKVQQIFENAIKPALLNIINLV